MQEINHIIQDISAELKIIDGLLDREKLKNKLNSINQELECDTEIWKDIQKTTILSKEKNVIEKKLLSFDEINESLENCIEFYKIFIEEKDKKIGLELENELRILKEKVEKIKISAIFSDKNDNLNAFLEINSGTGGTDSQDWAAMLMRMYIMWAEKNGFSCNIIDQNKGEEAGIKNATILIKGDFIYGLLKNETGIHRLVRISPFNSNGKRQTSFAGIFVYPEVDDSIKIDINDKDLKIDVFRSSGAGGQSVNTTDSAVRIKHIPTGIVVQSQNERSQIQNKQNSMKTLMSRLYEYEMRKKNAIKEKIENEKSDISWGHQVRNYVFHPYQIVKDLRSNFETSNIKSIMDGDLDEMIKSVIIKEVKKNA